jgi:hypothetical protein
MSFLPFSSAFSAFSAFSCKMENTMRKALLVAMILFAGPAGTRAQSLPDTKPLTMKGDLARHMVDGIDRYLTAATAGRSIRPRRKLMSDPCSRIASAFARSSARSMNVCP